MFLAYIVSYKKKKRPALTKQILFLSKHILSNNIQTEYQEIEFRV